MKRPLLFPFVLALAVCLATPAYACGEEPPENLRVSPRVKQALRTAYVAQMHGRATRGPQPGATYYGRWLGEWYAVARFEVARRTRTVTFVRRPYARGWRAVGETAREVCTNRVPLQLIQHWWLVHTQGRCFALPS